MWTVRLFRDDQLPPDFQEPFIRSGYRACETTLSECLRSAVHRTNETLNFWTHFVPLFCYLWSIWHLGTYHLDFFNDPYTWPVLGLLVSICLYLTASSFAHLLQCLSERARHVCFFFDYSSIGIYSIGCCISNQLYSLPKNLIHTTYFGLYIPIGVFNTIFLCTFCACASRFMRESLLRHLCRLSSFVFPMIFSHIPVAYRVVFCPDDECEAASITFHRWEIVAGVLTALIFATHFPERVAPGKFDVFFHSHQIFHVATAVSSYLHMKSVLSDMRERRDFIEQTIGLPTFWNSFGLLLIMILIELLIILCFSIMIYSRPEPYHVYKLDQNGCLGKRQIANNYKHRKQMATTTKTE